MAEALLSISFLDLNAADRMQEIEAASGAPSPWSKQLFLNEFLNTTSKIYGAALEGVGVVGFLIVHLVLDEADISNFAVLSQFQGRGIGRALLQKMIDDVREGGAKVVTLEVRENNISARHLYESFGFEVVSVRKRYYTDTGEAAILMNLTLSESFYIHKKDTHF